ESSAFLSQFPSGIRRDEIDSDFREEVPNAQPRPRSFHRDRPVAETDLRFSVNSDREGLDELLRIGLDFLQPRVSAIPFEHRELGVVGRRIRLEAERRTDLKNLFEAS